MTSKDPGNAELARRIQEGGAHAAAAEAELCRRFWQRARLYGLRHLRGVTEAEDLAQQVMEVTLTALRRPSFASVFGNGRGSTGCGTSAV